MRGTIAVAEAEINASPDDVWRALTDPDEIEQYMFGSQVESSWEEGGDIVWKGEYDGKQYEDKGKIVEVDPPRRLTLTHFSPTSGKQDHPDNYHTLVYELEEAQDGTRIRLSQDNNASAEEAESSRANWERMLSGLKKVVEHRQPAA